MFEMEIGIGEEKQYARRFGVYADDTAHLRDPLSEVRDRIVESVGEQFRTEGAHGGTPWPQLSPDYAALKEAAFPGRPILVRTGAMRHELLAPPDKGTVVLTDDRLVYGVKPGTTDKDGQRIDVRAEAHQTGHGVVPRRPWLALTLADRREFDRIFVRHFNAMKNRIFGART